MEGYPKYKLLKRYHSSRDIVVVSREDGDNIGCNIDEELGKLGKRLPINKVLVFGPNIAFFKSTGTSNPGLLSVDSLPANVKPYYNKYIELKDTGLANDPEHPQYKDYLMLEDVLRKTKNAIKGSIDTNDNAISTVFEGVYFPFLSCFRGYYKKMNDVTIPTTGESFCDFLPSSITTLRSRYFINSYFNCYSELRISAALGGKLWDTEFKDLRKFLLNNKKINTRCSSDFEEDKILPIDVEGSGIPIEELASQNINKMLIEEHCLREKMVDFVENAKEEKNGGKRKGTKRKQTKRKKNRRKSTKRKQTNRKPRM